MKSKSIYKNRSLNEENIRYVNPTNNNMKPRFILNKFHSNFSTNETIENLEKKCNMVFTQIRHLKMK
jgi:hypothetical protein